eukprot:gene11908-13874_t
MQEDLLHEEDSNNVETESTKVIEVAKTTRKERWLAAMWIIIWMALNMTLQMANKYLFCKGFKYPVFIILTGTFVTTIGSMIAVFVLKMAPFPKEALRKRKWTLLATAVFQSLTYVLENISITTIPIALNQIIKSTSPAFIIVLALMMYGQRISMVDGILTLTIIVGAALAVVHNPTFLLGGFLYAVASTIFACLQTLLLASLLQDPALNTMSILTVTALPSTITIIPIFVVMELPKMIKDPTPPGALVSWTIVGILAFAALFYNLSHFYIVRYTSALYYAIVGNAKVVILIVVSSLLFQNNPALCQDSSSFTPVNYVGMVLTLGAFFVYNALKYRRKAASNYTKLGDEDDPNNNIDDNNDHDLNNSICMKALNKIYKKGNSPNTLNRTSPRVSPSLSSSNFTINDSPETEPMIPSSISSPPLIQ